MYPISHGYNNRKCTYIFAFLRSQLYQLWICFLFVGLFHSLVVIFWVLHWICVIKELKHQNSEREDIEPIRKVYQVLREGLRRGVGQWCPWPKILILKIQYFFGKLKDERLIQSQWALHVHFQTIYWKVWYPCDIFYDLWET